MVRQPPAGSRPPRPGADLEPPDRQAGRPVQHPPQPRARPAGAGPAPGSRRPPDPGGHPPPPARRA
ncbi:MAG TPA: hypothetical protein VFA46_22365 [Actinomycetes bacterium]|nr:hypothetical protein [Actinomycetes bacterium]